MTNRTSAVGPPPPREDLALILPNHFFQLEFSDSLFKEGTILIVFSIITITAMTFFSEIEKEKKIV